MILTEKETCINCETQCLQCRDARVTEKWSDGSSQPKDYDELPKMSPQTENELRERLNKTLDDDLRFNIAEVLRKW